MHKSRMHGDQYHGIARIGRADKAASQRPDYQTDSKNRDVCADALQDPFRIALWRQP